MGARLKIGSYILDAAASGSTSTTSGARLWLGEDGPVAKWTETRTGMTVAFIVTVTAASAAALKTALEALRDAAVRNVNSDLVLERTSGTTLFQWKVSDGAFSRIIGDMEVQQLGAIDSATDAHVAAVLLTFNGERVGISSDGAGDPDDVLEPLDWNVAFDANGRGTCTVSAVFQTRLDATVYANGLRTTNRPAWMGTAWRFVSVTYQLQQQLNQTSPVPETAYQPCTVTVLFRAMPSAFAGSSAFADVVDLDYTVSATRRQPIGENAGGSPGYDVTISGSLQFKCESDSTFDVNDTTSVAGSALRAKALACLAVIRSDALTRAGVGMVEMDEAQLTNGGTTGEVAFALTGVASLPGDNLSYEESLTVEVTPTDKLMRGSRAKRVFKDAGGPDVTIRHTLTISSLALPSYSPPGIVAASPDLWLARASTRQMPPPLVTGNGTRIYNASWTYEWEWLGTESPNV